MSPPQISEDHVRFSYVGDEEVTALVLQCDRAVDGPREFCREPGEPWHLNLPRPILSRLEYRFAVARGEDISVILDEANPVRVRTAFGERSVLELPGYAPPWWLDADQVEGWYDPFTLSGETFVEVPVTVWSPLSLAPGTSAPLLLVHDGPEYDQLSSITAYSAALIAAGTLPPHRLALAHPVLRDAWYSGSPAYLRTIAQAGLARIEERYAVSGPVVVMGASLGGLTALLVGLLAPQIGGVFAQSG